MFQFAWDGTLFRLEQNAPQSAPSIHGPPTREDGEPAASRVLSSFATSKAAADVPPRVRGDIVDIRAERAAKRAITTVAADKSKAENRPQAEYLFPFTIREAAADAPPDVRRGIVHIRAERAAKRSLPRTTADKSKAESRPQAEYLFPFYNKRGSSRSSMTRLTG